MSQKLQSGQEAEGEELKQLKSQLQSATEEKQGLEQALGEELSSLQARLGEEEALVKQLREEGEKLQGRLVEVEDAREVAQSELASLQSDLATLQSERNTQRMAKEAVSLGCEASVSLVRLFSGDCIQEVY